MPNNPAARLCLAAAILALAPLARAEELARIDTPSGPAVITRQDVGSVLSIGGQNLPLDGAFYAGFGEKVGDVVLLHMSGGGSACPGFFAWLDTRPGLVRLTETFGTCSEMAEVSWNSEAVLVTMPTMIPGEGLRQYAWDGKTASVTETALPEPESGLPPSAGAAVWLGRHPSELMAAPEWRPLFVSLMGEAAYTDAQRIIQVAANMEAEGNWIVGEGCQPHACDIAKGVVALGLDGRLTIALWEKGKGAQIWGDPGQGRPTAISRILQQR